MTTIHKSFNIELKFPKEVYDHIKAFKDTDCTECLVESSDMKIILQIFDLMKELTDSPSKIKVVSE